MKYWYVVYSWSNGSKFGTGSMVNTTDGPFFNIKFNREWIMKNNDFQGVVITNWIELTEEQSKDYLG